MSGEVLYGAYDARSNIGGLLQRKLRQKDISPPRNAPLTAMPAIFRSNEVVTPDFFEEVQQMMPDGYLIGPGIGTIVALVGCFPRETPIKGIVISDIHPHVIISAKLAVNELAKQESWDDFRVNFLELSETEYYGRLQEMIAQEDVPALKQRLRVMYRRGELRSPTPIGEWKRMQDSRYSVNETDQHTVNIFDSIKEYYPILHQLAKTGNIAVIYTSIANEDFIQAVGDLPDYRSSRNIVYLSNIPQFLLFEEGAGNSAGTNSLAAYQHSPQNAIFVDAVNDSSSTGGHFRLRAHHSLPHYARSDFYQGPK